MKSEFTAAAAQISPVYHDKEATVDKTCRWIEQAGSREVDIIVFPETHVPGYPYWRGNDIPEWTDLMVDLQKNSLSVEDEAIAVLGDAIREANVHVVLGANELDDAVGSETIYNSLLYFDRSGDLVRRHRKLTPTHLERAIWGRGDPANLDTHGTEIGRIGGLICYENHMTLSKAALTAMGEDIHPAVWPAFWTQNEHPGNKSAAESLDAIHTCDQYPAMREYAFETQSFVVSASAYMTEDVIEDFYSSKKFDEHDQPGEFSDPENIGHGMARGGSMLVNPAGIVKEGPVIDEETMLVTTFDRDVWRATKAYFDAAGHYSRWDSMSLAIDGEEVTPSPSTSSTFKSNAISDAAIGEIADEFDVSADVVEDIERRLRDS